MTRNGRDAASSHDPNPRAVGRRIARARRDAGGMTQRELANLLQVSERSVAAYEAGTVLPFKYLGKIEAAVDKPRAWLLYGDEALPDAGVVEELERVRESIAERLDRMDERLERLPPDEAPPRRSADARDGAGLVDALDRLVELRYQEMISEAEFAAAKALLFGLDRPPRREHEPG